MSMVKINWHPDKKEMHKLGFSGAIFLFVIGFISIWPEFYRSGQPLEKSYLTMWIFFGMGAATALLMTGHRLTLPIYYFWMGIAFVMGNLTSRVLLVLIYYGMFLPIGLLMRLVGRDKLLLKRQDCDSYWQDVPPVEDPERYQRQF